MEATRISRSTRRRIRWVSCIFGVSMCGATALGQSAPAARLLPARPVEDTVQRSATPEYPAPGGYRFDVPSSVPAPNFGGRSTTAPVRPQVPPQPVTVEKPKGLLGTGMDSVKGMFGAKPADPQTTPPQAIPQPVAPPPGQYAGVPAYRWYGYGSPTPGNNPYAPTGLSPRGSANWYQQSGATPGAFPVPVVVTLRANGFEPPSYTGSAQPADGHYLAGTRVPLTTSSDAPPVADSTNRTVAQTTTDEPPMPTGNGTLVSGTTIPGDVAWQPSATRPSQPIAVTPNTTGPQSFDPTWQPSRTQPATTPSVSMIRGQAPLATSEDVEGTIRSACYGRASSLSVTQLGQKKLHVKLIAPTESDARDAAAVVSGLPQLKAFSITFEATIGR